MLPTPALTLAALSLGLMASPHCALMCGSACAGVSGGCRRGGVLFQLGRLAGYAGAGALAAGSMAALASWSSAVPVLRPVWMLLQLGLLGLGLWWLTTGRQAGRLALGSEAPIRIVRPRALALRASLAGLAWVALPCAALQGALLLAALAGDAGAGALLMALFALASAPALTLAPWAWSRLRRLGGGASSIEMLGRRVAGLGLVLTAGWALSSGLWQRLAAWCA